MKYMYLHIHQYGFGRTIIRCFFPWFMCSNIWRALESWATVSAKNCFLQNPWKHLARKDCRFIYLSMYPSNKQVTLSKRFKWKFCCKTVSSSVYAELCWKHCVIWVWLLKFVHWQEVLSISSVYGYALWQLSTSMVIKTGCWMMKAVKWYRSLLWNKSSFGIFQNEGWSSNSDL